MSAFAGYVLEARGTALDDCADSEAICRWPGETDASLRARILENYGWKHHEVKEEE